MKFRFMSISVVFPPICSLSALVDRQILDRKQIKRLWAAVGQKLKLLTYYPMSANKPVVDVPFCSERRIWGSTTGGSHATCRSTAWHAQQAFKLTTDHAIAFAS
jgi:hypothetical protein